MRCREALVLTAACGGERKKPRRINTIIKMLIHLKMWCSASVSSDAAICFHRRCDAKAHESPKIEGRDESRLIFHVPPLHGENVMQLTLSSICVYSFMKSVIYGALSLNGWKHPRFERYDASQCPTGVVWLPSCSALIQFNCCLYESWWW